MTNKQYKICKYIKERRKLTDVLKKFGIEDYIVLQEIVGAKRVSFSDSAMNENTYIMLKEEYLEETEERGWNARDKYITRAIAIIALAISFVSMIISYTSK